MNSFNCIGIIGRLDSQNTEYSLKRLINYLEKQHVEVIIEQETASLIAKFSISVESRDVLADRCDLIIVVGGDGSLLAAARSFAGTHIKLLGINRGRLGFLTDIAPEDIEYKVGEVLEGKYQSEKRSLLSCELLRDGDVIFDGVALNDVVVHPGEFIRMIEFELYIDNDFVYRQRSDGLIISSPTGSTAYALSGGGPIMHPQLDAIVLVPMNPHTLTSRPIVIHGESRIKLIISRGNYLNPHVTCDGQNHAETQKGDELVVYKSARELELIHPKGTNFYETCRSKLGWANQTTS